MKKSAFSQIMEKGTLIFLALSVLSFITWQALENGVFLTLFITFATFLYHLAVRLAVGEIVERATAGGVNYNRAWFRQSQFEAALYRKLKVHKWKLNLPTYIPEKFSLKDNTPGQVASNTCCAEIVHEINAAVSFVPVVLSVILPVLRDTIVVFVLTSVAAALFDMLFVVIQRYNRPRLLRMAERRKNLNNHNTDGKNKSIEQ